MLSFYKTKHISNRWISLFILFFFSVCMVIGQNPIVTENALPGNPSSEWEIVEVGDESIQGFATDISVNKDSTIHFKIDVDPVSDFSIKIYRLGYYQGLGARLQADLGTFSGIAQPEPNYDPQTGRTECSNWSETASWHVPATAVSGIYFAKLTRLDNNGSSHLVFIVRDDNSYSDLLFKTSDATWQAYNSYGGHSLYVGPIAEFGHAVKVSYDRPFFTRNGDGGGNGTKDWLFDSEYPMIRWLERNGYDVSYSTDLDMSRDNSPITLADHKVLLSVGHDEYWSLSERTRFENARDTGVNLAFFSGNECYWKTRWEDNYRTMVCYKEGTLGEYSCGGKCDPLPDTWTGLWREGCNPPYGETDGCKPENSLSGQMSWEDGKASVHVPATYKDHNFWRNTSVKDLESTEVKILNHGSLGDEWDPYQPEFADFYPKHQVRLSHTRYRNKDHYLTLYKHESGALIFAVGSMQWSWGLDSIHDNGNQAPDRDMQQATVNIFADMGVAPNTIQNNLIDGISSSDQVAPVSVILSPAHGSDFPNIPIKISGTASDPNGGIIMGI
ncbi:MAG: hypothetical protein IPH84_15500, partial [Bacteroidales bacterium]|nr:hypothetical protein [Bacteroidales bacterium]